MKNQIFSRIFLTLALGVKYNLARKLIFFRPLMKVIYIYTHEAIFEST